MSAAATDTEPPTCPACRIPTRPRTVIAYRSSRATAFCCPKCGHREGRLLLAPNDERAVHGFVKRQLNKLLMTPGRKRSGHANKGTTSLEAAA